jgi:hypothetical protein
MGYSPNGLHKGRVRHLFHVHVSSSGWLRDGVCMIAIRCVVHALDFQHDKHNQQKANHASDGALN